MTFRDNQKQIFNSICIKENVHITRRPVCPVDYNRGFFGPGRQTVIYSFSNRRRNRALIKQSLGALTSPCNGNMFS